MMAAASTNENALFCQLVPKTYKGESFFFMYFGETGYMSLSPTLSLELAPLLRVTVISTLLRCFAGIYKKQVCPQIRLGVVCHLMQ